MNNLLSILTSDGFNEKFEDNLRRYSLPQTKAYEMTEQQHEKVLGRRHYSGFDSFRKVRSRKFSR